MKTKSALPICPHPDCGCSLQTPIYHHGIVFCSYCQKSILVNPFSHALQKLTPTEFMTYFIKTKYKLYISIGMMLLFFVFLMDNIEAFNFGVYFWVAVSAVLLILVGVGIYVVEKKSKNHHDCNINNQPIMAGVDTYELIKDDIKVSFALDVLSGHFGAFGACCPDCTSQRLHEQNHGFKCQHCHHQHVPNPKLAYLQVCQQLVMFVLLFTLMGYFGVGFKMMLGLLLSWFLMNAIFDYYWFKIPKWLA